MEKETDMYNNTCRHEFEEIKNMLQELKASTDATHKKLYVGNGHPSISVQLDRLNMFKKTACWLGGAITLTTIGLVAKLIFEVVTK